jgi:hypothetical protein
MAKRLKDLTSITTPEEISSLVVVSNNATNLVTVSNLRTTILTKASPSTLGAVKVGTNLTISEAGVLSVVSELPAQSGNNGKYLTTNGNGTLSWGTVTVPPSLPSQGGNSGKYLKTNGVVASWEAIPPPPESLPPRANNAGKFLTTNGTTISWAEITGLPAQTSNENYFLTTDGTTASWSDAIQVDQEGIVSLQSSLGNSINMLSPVIFPSLTTVYRDQLEWVAGTVIFNSSDSVLQVYTGTSWEDLH